MEPTARREARPPDPALSSRSQPEGTVAGSQRPHRVDAGVEELKKEVGILQGQCYDCRVALAEARNRFDSVQKEIRAQGRKMSVLLEEVRQETGGQAAQELKGVRDNSGWRPWSGNSLTSSSTPCNKPWRGRQTAAK